MSNWLVIGSSPNARAHVEWAMANADIDTTITCNGGINLCPDPTYYLVFSKVGEKLYRKQYLAAQGRGTKIIGGNFGVSHPDHPPVNFLGKNTPPKPLDRGVLARNPARPPVVDVLISVGPYSKSPPRFIRSMYNTRSSGILCTQFAVNNWADMVTLAGFEGYGVGPSDYFDGRRRTRPAKGASASASAWTREFYGPVLQSIVRECRGVFFTFVGKPAYTIVGNNQHILIPPKAVPTDPVRDAV